LTDGPENPIIETLMHSARAFDAPVCDRFADDRNLHPLTS